MGYALRRMWLPQRVASLLWNQWQVCRGMRGNFAMESVASFAWNQWQLSYGTGGNFRAEYAPQSVNCTQFTVLCTIHIGYFDHRLQFYFVSFIFSPLLCTQWSL